MEITIRFINKNGEPLKPNSLVFSVDSWNDYGYYDYFNVSYVNKSCSRILIGSYRIISKEFSSQGNFNTNSTFHNIKNEKITNDFLSLGVTTSFYIKLYEVLNENGYSIDDMLNILKGLNDILVITPDDIIINPVATLEGKSLEITRKSLNYKFEDVNKTLFRYGENEIYDLNTMLKKYDHSLFDFLDSNSCKEILNDLNTNSAFLNEFINHINKSNDYVIKPLVEKIVSFINNNHELVESSKTLLKGIRKKYELDVELNAKINKLLNVLGKVSRLVNDIKEKLKVTDDEIDQFTIGHYTSLNTLPYLVSNKKETAESTYMRLTNINQLNDPLEGKVIFNFLDPSGKNIESTHNTQNYVSSATTEKDSLPMWNLYAEHATGIFLIYDKEYLKEIVNNMNSDTVSLYHVCYFNSKLESLTIPSMRENPDYKITKNYIREKLKSLKEEIHSLLKNDLEEIDKRNLVQIIENFSFLFKSIEYAYEKEIRFFINSPQKIQLNPKSGQPFPFLYTYNEENELQYSKIILGPRSTVEQDYIAPYISYISNNKITVEKSQIHFR